MFSMKSGHEGSGPIPDLRTDRICRALEQLRRAALALDTRPRPERFRVARAALSRALGMVLRHLRRGAAFADIALEGREPDIGVAFLLLEMDDAAVRLLDDQKFRDSS